MSQRYQHTEPIILANSGTKCRAISFGALALHDFTHSTGLQHVSTPECSLFLVNSCVTATEVWQGERLRQRAYEPGDLVFLPASTDLSTYFVSAPYSETMIRIPMPLIHKASGDGPGISDIEQRYCAFPRRLVFGLTQSIRNMALSSTMNDALPMITESMGLALAGKVLAGLQSTISEAPLPYAAPQGMSDARRARAVAFIEANLGAPVTLADIAGAAAFSPHHFARAFKLSMGVSPVRYLWQRRIALARKMLRETGTPLADVAHSCGYSAQGPFTTAFKLSTGMTPAAFRRQAN